MRNEKNNLFTITLFSIIWIWIVQAMSSDEIPTPHPINSKETQAVINKSSIFSFKKRSSILEDFLFFKQDELELLEKSDQFILPRITNYSIEEIKVILSKKDDNLDIKTKTKLSINSIFVEAFQVLRTFPARPNFNYYDRVENRIIKPSLML